MFLSGAKKNVQRGIEAPVPSRNPDHLGPQIGQDAAGHPGRQYQRVRRLVRYRLDHDKAVVR